MSSKPMSPRRVAIYGGSFNPPHVGHVLAVAYVLATQPVDEVLVVPCFLHPFAKELAAYEDRFAMCEAAMGWIPGTTISRIEAELGGESRTLRTLEHLAKVHPEWKMRLLIGSDILAEVPKWHGFSRVSELAPPLVIGRAGVLHPDAPHAFLPEVSSTEVRALVAKGAWDTVSPVVPREVLRIVRERRLYGAPA